MLALMLSFAGGFVELWSVTRYGVFSGMETGNLITGFVSLAGGDTETMTWRFVSVAVFFVATLLAEIARRLLEKKSLRPDILMLAVSGICLIPVMAIPNDGIVPSIFLTLFCAFQYSCFRSLKGSPYSTTMMTNLMTNFAKSIVASVFEKKKEKYIQVAEYFGILAFFILGALSSYFLIQSSFFTPLLMGIPLLISLICFPLDIFGYGLKLEKKAA